MATTKVDIGLIDTTGTASSSTFLRGDGAWSAAGGAWTLIGTSVASSSASLTITGLDSTYDTYAVQFSDLVPATDDVDAWFRFGDSSGIDSGASDYAWRYLNDDINGTSTPALYEDRDNADSEIAVTRTAGDAGIGNASGEGISGFAYIHGPGDSTMLSSISGTYSSVTPTTLLQPGEFYGARLSVITMDRIQFLFSSGNIATGRLTVWGISHA